jgi:hypothetical protein
MTTDLTNSQLRMWFMHTVDPRRTDLTIACAAELRVPMSIIELQERLGSVVLAHPQLSAVLTAGTSGSPQWTEVDVLDALRSAVLPTRLAPTAEQIRLLYGEFTSRPWDLEHDVPWTVQLVDTAESTFLFCRFHHIVCDGDRSLALFLDGLAETFGTEPVPSLTKHPRRTGGRPRSPS